MDSTVRRLARIVQALTHSRRWLIYLLILVLGSISYTATVSYLTARQLSDSSFTILHLVRTEFVWLTLFAASLIAVGLVLKQLRTDNSIAVQPESDSDDTDFESASPPRQQTLVLKRNAERLTDVEHDLIQRLSNRGVVDRETAGLIKEMHICTNRMLAELRDRERVMELIDS